MTGVGGGEEGRDKEWTESEARNPGEVVVLVMGTSVVMVGSGSEESEGGRDEDTEEEAEEEAEVQLKEGPEVRGADAAEVEEKEGETDESWIRGTDKTGDENPLFMLKKIE